MKKMICFAFALVLLFSFTSCEQDILDDINLENRIEDLAVSTTIPNEYAHTPNDTLRFRTTDKDLNAQ